MQSRNFFAFGQTYNIVADSVFTAQFKKVGAVTPPETFFLLTESGNPYITEDGNNLVTE